MKPIVKALICENARLEELMDLPISEILDYKSRADSVNPEDALHYLADMYIDNCGVSQGKRSFADYCAEYWIKRLVAKQKNLDIESEKLIECEESNIAFCDLLSKYSDKYTPEVDEYDIYPLTTSQLRESLLGELQETDNEKEKIILCAGALPCLLYGYDDNWLACYSNDRIEEGIVNLEDRKLIEYRAFRNNMKYRPSRNMSNITSREAKPFTIEEIDHFVKLNNRLVELQKEVMNQVEVIKCNLNEQIVKGFHQYETFYIEGLIYIENEIEDNDDNKCDPLLEVLVKSCPHYLVCITDEYADLESLKESNSHENNWYANWSGLFYQLEENHGIKICRAFRVLFDDSETFTIPDIMKIQPEWFFSQIKISI